MSEEELQSNPEEPPTSGDSLGSVLSLADPSVARAIEELLAGLELEEFREVRRRVDELIALRSKTLTDAIDSDVADFLCGLPRPASETCLDPSASTADDGAKEEHQEPPAGAGGSGPEPPAARTEDGDMDKESGSVYCEDCEMWLNGPTQYEDHLHGKKHKNNLKKKLQDGNGEAQRWEQKPKRKAKPPPSPPQQTWPDVEAKPIDTQQPETQDDPSLQPSESQNPRKLPWAGAEYFEQLPHRQSHSAASANHEHQETNPHYPQQWTGHPNWHWRYSQQWMDHPGANAKWTLENTLDGSWPEDTA